MWAVAILALTGLILDVTLHVAAVVGLNPQDWLRPDWLAQLIFFGFFGATLIAANVAQQRREKRAVERGIVLRDGNPLWFGLLIKAAIVYGLFCAINFGVIDFRRAGGSPVSRPDGSYVVDPGHGRAVVPITAARYDQLRRRSVLGGSSFFLMFYLQVAFDMMRFARRPLDEMNLRVVRVVVA